MTAPGRIVGILGGMGPAATADLFARIVRATPAQADQEHLHILVESNPAVPDRTAAILAGGPDPLPLLQAGIRKLAAQGAELIAIPCNAAHHYLPRLLSVVSCPVLDMIDETAQAIRKSHGAAVTVGVLATSGTLACGLYQKALTATGLQCLTPEKSDIELLMQIIYGPAGIKAIGPSPDSRSRLQRMCQDLAVRGAEVFLLGCTELPLVLQDGDVPWPLTASNQVLAEAVVREAWKAPDSDEP